MPAKIPACSDISNMIRYREESNEVFSLALYDTNSCGSVVEKIKRLRYWYNARVRKDVGNGRYRSVRMASVRKARILDPYRATKIYDDFHQRINRVVKPLMKEIWRVDFSEHAGTQFIRYAPHGHYEPHTDSGLDLQERYFSVLCYLNDDFEGGRTSFPFLDYDAVPKKGRAIIFPSSYMHCAEPVIAGEKFVALTWVVGPVPVEWL